MRIVTNDEMRALDNTAVESIGIPSALLMENAGIEASRIVDSICQTQKYEGEVLVFCGKGKNGGDGLVVARRLIANGHRVRIFLMSEPNEYKQESSISLNILKQQRAKISVLENSLVLEEYFKSANPPFLAVDALLGTGLTRQVEGLFYDVINLINKNADQVISLDIPSGIRGDSGDIAGTAVFATHTISFGFPKVGHFLAPGAIRRGKLFHVDLGFPRTWAFEGDKVLLTHENTAKLLQQRDRFGHKNSFGHCLLVGGSPGRIGAIVMASNSCLKMGTGLVTVASWEDSFPSLEVKLSSEIMNFKITKDDKDFVVPPPGLNSFSSLVIGPGLGMRADGKEMITQILTSYSGPLVIDADGLNLISEFRLFELLKQRRGSTVLTPHPGEMARLLDVSKQDIINNPIDSIRQAVDKTNAIVVLKGATTFIHSIDGITWFNHYPNDGMATAGSGDVLAGMIGGFLGQGMHAADATRLAVYVHSLAGKFAAQNLGHRAMTATDIIENIGNSLLELSKHTASIISSPSIQLV